MSAAFVFNWEMPKHDTNLAEQLSLDDELLRLLPDDDRDLSTDFDFFFFLSCFSLDCDVEWVGEEAGMDDDVLGFSKPSLLELSVGYILGVPGVHLAPRLK